MSVVYTVGVNHRTAPLALRELLAVSADAVGERLRQLKNACHVREAAILSTCNRTEVYCLSDACARCGDAAPVCGGAKTPCLSETPHKITSWLGGGAGGEPARYLYTLQAQAAVRHLFRVASGLDSQLTGEPEIAGQVKQFAALARQSGASGTVINRLMESALAVAAETRTKTEIGRHSLSYPALAARAAANIFPDLRDTAVLFVGAGDVAKAGAPIFADRGVKRLAIAARTKDKAAVIAARHNAEAVAIAALPGALSGFDIIVSATASQVPIIGKGAVESALRRRRQKPMMFADLAVPRDLEAEIRDLENVFVYNLDQFGDMAADGKQRRGAAAARAEAIIERHVRAFMDWQSARKAAAQIRSLRAAADAAGEREIGRALARLRRGDDAAAVLEDTVRRLTGRLLHLPTVALRRDASRADTAAKDGDE